MLKKTPATTTSRQAVLDRLTGKHVVGPGLPTVAFDQTVQFDDPVAKFIEVLSTVGGQAHVIDDVEQIGQILGEIPVYANAKRVVSLVPEAIAGSLDVATIDDPHALASVDWTIARGEFAVAENGAIWVEGATMPHRVLLFIAQYLAIVVSRSQMVHNLHQGYARIGTPKSPFGVFVSGPSKTADIEQSLVLGAHGCRALQVFLTP
ncbi:YkgG family protein [Rhodopirellula maiorica SM1]|uniref:YkgG family protein n=1 Tax=Rhodopirellula maiorica SM1 TaxID=1265738 RepID=M5R802_9BACT|nr:LUD domain-containing protein [Rhodopirellula maiorica]EMI15613.1 YkgG family protein [Rhodopirellula maiorica SM1]